MKPHPVGPRFAIALALAVTPLLMAGCGSPLRSGADIHQEAGRPERAVELLQQQIAAHPDDARAHLSLGRAFAELDSAARAVAAFERAVALDTTLTPEAKRHRVSAAGRLRQRGLGFLAEAGGIPGDSPQRDERLTRAGTALRAARVLWPVTAGLDLDLYRLCLAERDSAGAESHLVEATRLALDQNDPRLSAEIAPIYRERGQEAVRRRDYRLGITLLDAAARLTPDNADVLTDLASAYLLEAETSGGGAKKSAAAYRDAGRLLEHVRLMRPEDPDVLYNLAAIRLRAGSAVGADSLMRSYLRLRIEDAEGWQLYEVVLRELKESERARLAGLAGDLLGADRPVTDPATWARQAADRHGPASALGRCFAEHGAPERIDARKDRGGRSEELWLYLRARRVAAFKDGAAVGQPLALER